MSRDKDFDTIFIPAHGEHTQHSMDAGTKIKGATASTKAEKLRSSNGILIGVLTTAAVIAGIIIISDDDELTSPVPLPYFPAVAN